MAIMQSLGHNGGKNNQKDKSYNFETDPSLIEQQRAIE